MNCDFCEARKFAVWQYRPPPVIEAPLAGKKTLRTTNDAVGKRLVTVGSRKSQLPHMARNKEGNRVNNNSGKKRICTVKSVERVWQREGSGIKENSGTAEGAFDEDSPYDDEFLRLRGSVTFECGMESGYLTSSSDIRGGNGCDDDTASFDERQFDTSGNCCGFTSPREVSMRRETDDSLSVHDLVSDGNVTDLWPFEDVQMVGGDSAQGFRVCGSSGAVTDLSSSKGKISNAGWRHLGGISETPEVKYTTDRNRAAVSNESEVLSIGTNQGDAKENGTDEGCRKTLEQELLDDWNDHKTQLD